MVAEEACKVALVVEAPIVTFDTLTVSLEASLFISNVALAAFIVAPFIVNEPPICRLPIFNVAFANLN